MCWERKENLEEEQRRQLLMCWERKENLEEEQRGQLLMS
jgi:hypothetical protein